MPPTISSSSSSTTSQSASGKSSSSGFAASSCRRASGVVGGSGATSGRTATSNRTTAYSTASSSSATTTAGSSGQLKGSRSSSLNGTATTTTTARPQATAMQKKGVGGASSSSSSSSSGAGINVNGMTGNRGLKVRSTNPSVLPMPVLCVYSDKNQLVRKEQFRTPSSSSTKATTIPNKNSTIATTTSRAATSQLPARHRNNNNNENVAAVNHRNASTAAVHSVSATAVPPAAQTNNNNNTSRTTRLLQSTVSSMARVNKSNNNNTATASNAAKRTKLSSSTAPRAPIITASTSNKTGAGKVNRRRNESSFPPLEPRKAEMTSAVVSSSPSSSSSSSGSRGNQNKLATNPNLQLGVLASVGGGRPYTANSSGNSIGGGRSNNTETLVRASVVVETPSRVEAANHALSAPYRVSCPLPPTAPSPSTASSSSSTKKVTSGGARVVHSNLNNSGSDPTTSSVLASALPALPSAVSSFHSTSRITADNPDPKIQPQGSIGANTNHGRNPPPAAELAIAVNNCSALTLTQLVAGAGTVDTVDSSSVCATDNYSRSDVVFDYLPTTASDEATHHHNNQVVSATAAVAAVCVAHEQGEEQEQEQQVTTGSSIMGTSHPPIPHLAFTQGRKSVSAVDLVQQSSIKEDDLLDDFFQFVSPNDNIRKVTIQKTTQGLGLSVTGGVASASTPVAGAPLFGSSSPSCTGVDSGLVACSWPGLIRIKKIFPHGAAWQTGQLEIGDVLLAANGQPLTGCTNYEALEILRCSPRETTLVVCRIPVEIAEKMGMHPPETIAISCSSHNNWLSPVLTLSTIGEFEISMTKVNGSLGFTLRKEDESILGHYIRSLVKEPAISDGRISPGDKIISVNGVDMSSISHAEAVAFLRRCPDTVTIRLFRDSAVTPLSPLSPTEPELVGLNRPRPLLRQEAQDLLHDLAVRKQGGSRGASPAPALSGSPCSPRRRRLTKTPSPDLASVVKDRFGGNSSFKDNSSIAGNSTNSPPMSPLPELDMERDIVINDLDLTDSYSASFHTPSGGPTRISRPDFLDLSNSLVKKQRFMFTPPNDEPPSLFEIRQSGDGQPEPSTGDQGELEISEYLTPSKMTDSILDNGSRKSFIGGSFCIREDSESFSHHQPLSLECGLEDTMDEDFVSFHSSSTLERFAPQGLSDRDLNLFPLGGQSDSSSTNHGKGGLVKWKGVVLTPDEEYAEEAHQGLIQTIELNKGWNSRLGFSVGIQNDGQLVISAIYEESVAAKDGRLSIGDHVLRVNGEKLAGCSKEYVIDILRKTRGPVAITVKKTT